MSISRSTFLLAVLVASLVTATSRAEDLAGTVAAHLRDSGALSGYRVNVKSKSGTVWLEGQVGGPKTARIGRQHCRKYGRRRASCQPSFDCQPDLCKIIRCVQSS